MDRERDEDADEALSWAGDEERGVAAPRRADRAAEQAPDDEELGGPAPANGLVLVVYGVLAGATLISAIGWVTAVGASSVSFPDLVSEVMYQFGEFLAIAGPVIWFAAVLVLGRRSRPARRILWHLVGLAVTAPWPLLVLGGIG